MASKENYMEFIKLTPTEKKSREEIANKISLFLRKKHPDAYVPFTISHILSVGHGTLRDVSDEEVEETIKDAYAKDAAATKEGHILVMTPEFQEELIRAAVDVCRNYEVFEILSFARTLFVF